MNRFVSLLAVALVSSLFAAGCGKLKTCADAKKQDVCEKADSFEEGVACVWEAKADGKEGEGECKNWAPSDVAKAACAAGSASEDVCKGTDSTDAGTKCVWNDKADPKCQAGKKPAEAKKDK